jgi:hypothetical protein
LAKGGRGLAAWGKLVAQWALGRPSLYGIPAAVPLLHLGETRYRAPATLGRISASALGAVAAAWIRLDRDSELRRRNGARLDLVARESSGVRRIVPPSGSAPGYLRYPLLSAGLADAVARDRGVRALGLERGYPHPLSHLPALRGRGLNGDQPFPGAASLSRELVTLPTHRFLREADLESLGRLLAAEAGRPLPAAGSAGPHVGAVA